ncbi:putative transcription factor C3H family [Dioscorea sansibarensis]
MVEYHAVADKQESLLPLTEDDCHPENNPRMDFSSYNRQTKFSKMKAVNEDGPKSLKRPSTSENIALEQETHINRKTDKWSSPDGQFSELAGSVSPDLHAWRNQSTSVSPKRCWSQSNRSLSRSPRVSKLGSKRWENRGRARGGLIVHDGDFPDSKGGSKRSNWDGMTAVQTTRRIGITNKEIKALVPALDQSDNLGRSISPGLESWRRHVYNVNLKHGCSQSERNFISNKDGAKMPNWETVPGDQTTNEDGYSKRHSGGRGAALNQFEELDRSISVDHQRWRRRRHSISPKHSWCMRKRSRSPSPPLGLKSGMENWETRGRTSTGGSAAAYRDFATEKFGKGSHFRELSEDDAWRHSENASREFGGGRFERGRYTRYHSRENFDDDLLEQKDFSRDRLLQREPSHHDGNWEKHEHHQNNRSTEHHYISTKERHPRVSTCNYDHHDDNSHSLWSRRNGAREINYDRRDADSPFRQRLKSRRVSSDTPCKYFAVGHCRRGEDCKFSHQPLHGHPKGRQQDDKQDYNTRTETAMSLSGSERGNRVSITDALISSRGMHNGNDSRMSNSSSMDDELLRKSKDAQSKASESPEQNITHDASEQYDSAISADMMSKSTHMEQIISNKEQTSSKGGCVVGDTTRSKTEMDFATIPFTAVSFTEKSWSRSRSEQQLGPELHSFAPSAQDMKGASLSPSGKTVQETVCSIAPNGDSQLGSGQILSPTNQQMHFASQVGHTEQIQQSPVSLSQHVVRKGRCNQQMDSAAQVGHSELIQQGPVFLSQLVVPKGRCNQQMDSAAQVGHSELIQQSPVSHENGLSQHIVPEGQCNQQMHSAAQVGHNEQMQQSPVSDKSDLSQSIAHSVVPKGQSNQIFSQDHPNIQPILISDDESDQQAGDSSERTSRVTSGTSANQVVVITDEAAHVTNLLSSPSQVCQQPSQPHAILTPIGSAGSTLSLMASKPSIVKLPSPPLVSSLGGSEEFVAPHHNQTPASNSYKDAHLDNNENRQDKILEPHHNQTQVSDNCYKGAHSDENEDRQNGKLELKQVELTVSIKSSHSDENQNRQNGKLELKQVEHVKEVTVSIKGQNEKVHVAPTEEVDHDAQIDGRNKNTKETNGMKMFKFALVEFVKDQLKPTWKEGHLSREAHKAIVKKVVEKVIDSVKGPNFPQTQHKINQYMEHSKSKLTKLVHLCAVVAYACTSTGSSSMKLVTKSGNI